MTTGEWIFIIILGLVGAILIVSATSKDDSVALRAFIGTILGMIASISITHALSDPKPEAIDVYRDKTTLQITYKDSVAIDSVVVWKDEFNIKTK